MGARYPICTIWNNSYLLSNCTRKCSRMPGWGCLTPWGRWGWTPPRWVWWTPKYENRTKEVLRFQQVPHDPMPGPYWAIKEYPRMPPITPGTTGSCRNSALESLTFFDWWLLWMNPLFIAIPKRSWCNNYLSLPVRKKSLRFWWCP